VVLSSENLTSIDKSVDYFSFICQTCSSQILIESVKLLLTVLFWLVEQSSSLAGMSGRAPQNLHWINTPIDMNKLSFMKVLLAHLPCCLDQTFILVKLLHELICRHFFIESLYLIGYLFRFFHKFVTVFLQSLHFLLVDYRWGLAQFSVDSSHNFLSLFKPLLVLFKAWPCILKMFEEKVAE